MLDRQRRAYELVRTHLGVAADRNARLYNMKVNQTRYAVGDWVYVYNPRRYRHRSPKWSRAYEGPFRIEEVISEVIYVVRKSPQSKPRVVHVDKLKLHSHDGAGDIEPDKTGHIGPAKTGQVDPARTGRIEPARADYVEPASADPAQGYDVGDVQRMRPSRTRRMPARYRY